MRSCSLPAGGFYLMREILSLRALEAYGDQVGNALQYGVLHLSAL